MLLIALVGFALGGGAVGWLVLRGALPGALHNAAGLSGWRHGESAPQAAAPSAAPAPTLAPLLTLSGGKASALSLMALNRCTR